MSKETCNRDIACSFVQKLNLVQSCRLSYMCERVIFIVDVIHHSLKSLSLFFTILTASYMRFIGAKLGLVPAFKCSLLISLLSTQGWYLTIECAYILYKVRETSNSIEHTQYSYCRNACASVKVRTSTKICMLIITVHTLGPRRVSNSQFIRSLDQRVSYLTFKAYRNPVL